MVHFICWSLFFSNLQTIIKNIKDWPTKIVWIFRPCWWKIAMVNSQISKQRHSQRNRHNSIHNNSTQNANIIIHHEGKLPFTRIEPAHTIWIDIKTKSLANTMDAHGDQLVLCIHRVWLGKWDLFFYLLFPRTSFN